MTTDIIDWTALIHKTTLSTLTCGVCSIPFAIPKDLHDKVKRDGSVFYCPNGHNIGYNENENKRLRRRLEFKDDEIRWQTDMRKAAETEVRSQRNRSNALKGHLKRIKAKVANGVCPVPGCKRSFADVIDHLRTVHPDYHKHEDAPGHERTP